jgi:hypothetical protein
LTGEITGGIVEACGKFNPGVTAFIVISGKMVLHRWCSFGCEYPQELLKIQNGYRGIIQGS